MGNNRGFTIIEVLLFLSITAGLFIIALTYTSGSINETRFKDVNEQFTSFMQQQVTDIKNASDNRPSNDVVCPDSATSNPGASDTCTLLGKVFVFSNSNTVSVAQVIGTNAGNSGADFFGDRASVQAMNPQVVADSSGQIIYSDSFTLPWGATFTGEKFLVDGGGIQDFNTLLVLRSKISEHMFYSTWLSWIPNQASGYNAPPYNLAFRLSGFGIGSQDKPSVICVKPEFSTSRRFTAELTSNANGLGNIIGTIKEGGSANVGGIVCP